MSSSPYCLLATFAFWYVCPVTCNVSDDRHTLDIRRSFPSFTQTSVVVRLVLTAVPRCRILRHQR